MARKTLETWIHESLADLEKEGKLTRLVLSHMAGTGRTEIHTMKLAPKTSYLPKAVAEMLIGKADVHCQDVRGESRFVVDAYWKASEHESSFPFTRHGQTDTRNGGLYHSPTEEGRLSQRMETESSIITAVLKRQEKQDAREDKNADRIEREREQFFDHRIRMMAENNKMFELLKELYIKTSVDVQKQQMEQLQYQRASKREEKLMEAAPLLLNMVTGREIVPQSKVDTTIVEALAKALTPEMVGYLGMLDIPEESKAILLHRINQVKEKQMAEETHRNSLPQTSMSGEEELAGKGEPH